MGHRSGVAEREDLVEEAAALGGVEGDLIDEGLAVARGVFGREGRSVPHERREVEAGAEVTAPAARREQGLDAGAPALGGGRGRGHDAGINGDLGGNIGIRRGVEGTGLGRLAARCDGQREKQCEEQANHRVSAFTHATTGASLESIGS